MPLSRHSLLHSLATSLFALACTTSACSSAKHLKVAAVEPVASPVPACEVRAFVREGESIPIFTENTSESATTTLPWISPGIIFGVDAIEGERVHYRSAESLTEPSQEVPGEGWLDIGAVTLNLNMSEVSPALHPPHAIVLREGASAESSPVRTYHQEDLETQLMGCQLGWAQVRVRDTASGEEHQGWLAPGDHCGNPLTTCN